MLADTCVGQGGVEEGIKGWEEGRGKNEERGRSEKGTWEGMSTGIEDNK